MRAVGTRSNVLTLAVLWGWDTGDYSVVISDVIGQSRVVLANLTVQDPLITSQPASQTVLFGGSATFRVAAEGTPPLSYQWLKGGLALEGAAGTVLTVTNLQDADDGSRYSVVVNGPGGSATSLAAVVSVARLSVPDSLNAGVNGTVWCLAAQTDGKILLGGDFTSVGGVPRGYIARLNGNGSLDSGFSAGVDAPLVMALAVQSDNRILVVGNYTTLAGGLRERIGRLNPDGSLDASFNPGVNGLPQSLAIQPDGKIIVGGSYSTLGGQYRLRLGRLNPDGTVDPGFNSSADNTVFALVLLPDGKILVGGDFTALAGVPSQRIGRLNADGSPDTSFNASANGTVRCLLAQPDGGILAGGDFTMAGGVARSRIARFNAEGSLDTSFDLGADNTVHSMVAQADGGVVVGGAFAMLGGQARSRIGWLKADGRLDGNRVAVADNTVCALGIQSDGSLLAGGQFGTMSGQSRVRLARLMPAIPASQSLVSGELGVQWLRGGGGPDAWRAILEASTNGGASWIGLDAGTRISGGWQFGVLPELPNASVRARGFVTGGSCNGSAWFVQTTVGAPALSAQPEFVTTNALSAAGFRAAADGTAPLVWQWRKDGVDLLDSERIAGARSNVLVIGRVVAGDAGAYSVLVSNAYGWVVSQAAGLTVVDPMILAQPASQEIFAGQNAFFRVVAAGTSPLTYQWVRDGSPLAGATESSLVVPRVQWADSGRQFQVVVGSAGGSVTSSVAVLTTLAEGVPDSFNPGANGITRAMAVQPDGRILVGGDFTMLAGVARSYLGRLEADGRLDSTFAAVVDNGRVNSILLHSDGGIWVGGSFTSAAGQTRPRLCRIHLDGTLDHSFNLSADAEVFALAEQPDGKILVGGSFTSFGGAVRSKIARLNGDGSLDAAFNPGVTGTVRSLAVQPDGKIVVGGLGNGIRRLLPDGSIDVTFTGPVYPEIYALALQADGRIVLALPSMYVNGQWQYGIHRLLSDGSRDRSFTASTDKEICSLAAQADGKLFCGGHPLMKLSGQSVMGLGRLRADGSADNRFNPAVEGWVYSVAMQPDGAILAGGIFARVEGHPRAGLARLANTAPSSQSLAVADSAITWMRGGGAPEVNWTRFEFSTNGGVAWVGLGSGTRVAGGWQLSGVELPPGASVRARGFVSGGYGCGSGSFVETIAGAPVFVRAPESVRSCPGATVSFRVLAAGSPPPEWRWRKDGVDLAEGGRFSGTQSSELTLSPVSAQDAGAYSVRVSNSEGWNVSAAASLVLVDPLITLQPASLVAGVGSPAEFRVQAGGTAPLSYQWHAGGVPIAGATAETLALPSVQWSDDDAQFSVVVANGSGAVTSAVAALNVVYRPAVLELFVPYVLGSVRSVAVQRDGMILIGGDFPGASTVPRPYLARLKPDGTLDSAFDAAVSMDPVHALAVQPDDRIVAAGAFTKMRGQIRNRIARLNSDGTLDAAFNPDANNLVRTVLALGDGAVWVAGDFTTIGGQPRNRIARLNADGTLDESVNPGADGPVYCLAQQSDGKILVGGGFTTLGGQARNAIGRLNSNGALDDSFNLQADGLVRCLAVQADGRILVGGAFAVLGGQPRARLGRLNGDGSLDPSFHPDADGAFVSSFALQAGGSILVGGDFSKLGGQPRKRLGRLNADGSLDDTFIMDADNAVYALGLQADGKVLVGGTFGVLGGQARSCLARIANTEPALEALVGSGSNLTWVRGGASPEVGRVTLDVSTNGSSTWRSLGAGVRVPGGWEFSGFETPPGASLRARGYVSGGAGDASGWFVEAGAGLPFILAQPWSQQGIVGSNVLFSVGAGGTPPLSYHWFWNGALAGQTAAPVWTLPNAQSSDVGSQYHVVVSNAAGSVTSSVAVLTALQPSGLLTRGPYIMMGHFTNRSTVVWRTSVPLDGWVDYGLTEACERTAGSALPAVQHEVTLTGLEPGRVYWYRIRSGGSTLATELLRAGKGAGVPMRIAWLGDNRAYRGRQTIWYSQPDLVLASGEIAYSGDFSALDAEFFQYFGGVQPVTGILREVPLYWTPGDSEGTGCAAALEAFGALPEDHQSYSVEYGDLQIIAINSLAPPSPDWLRAKLAGSAKPWRLVFTHYPMFSATGDWGDADGAILRDMYLPILEEYKVNAVVASHNHYYWRSLPIQGIHHLVAGPCGAPLHALGGLPPFTAAATDTALTYLCADIEGDFMDFHLANLNGGSQIDEAVIDRQCAFQLDGLLDSSAVLLGSRPGGLPLYAAVSGRYLYVATAPATANDHFIFLSRTPSLTQRPLGFVWQKSGTAMAFDAFLAGKGADNTNRWYNFDGEYLNNLRTSRSAIRYDKSGWMEGVMDLQALYGQIPATLYLAAAAFGPGAGGALVPSQQFPAGDGDVTLGADEFLAVSTSAITRAMPPSGRLMLNRSGAGASLDFTGPANTAYDLEVSRDLVRWEPVARCITSASGQAQFTDSAAAANETRFYRARQVAP